MELAVALAMSASKLRELARSPADWVLMTLGTCSAVVYGTEPGVHIVLGLVDLLIEHKSVSVLFDNPVTPALPAGTLNEGRGVKARRRVGWRLRRSPR